MRGGVCRWWRELEKYRDQGRMDLRDRLWVGLGREEVPSTRDRQNRIQAYTPEPTRQSGGLCEWSWAQVPKTVA